jgi:hypothetical protein
MLMVKSKQEWNEKIQKILTHTECTSHKEDFDMHA